MRPEDRLVVGIHASYDSIPTKSTDSKLAFRTCRLCNIEKSLNEFHPNKAVLSGYNYKCLACHRVWFREYRTKNRDKINLRTRQRVTTEQRKTWRPNQIYTPEKNRKLRLARCPIKEQARITLRDAVKSGKITRPKSCSKCGNEHTRIEAHHHDYSKPLDVIWLCMPCHNIERFGPK